MDKQIVAYTYNGILLSIKMNELLIGTHSNVDECKIIMLSKRRWTKKSTYDTIPFTLHFKN